MTSATWHHLTVMVEYAATDRGRCRLCTRKIDKCEMRMKGYRNATPWAHCECWANPKYNKRLPDRPNQVWGYNKLSEKDQKYFMKTLWPFQVPDDKKTKLRMGQIIDLMKVEELKMELLKRGLRKTGKKQKLVDRLEAYLTLHKIKYKRSKERKQKLVPEDEFARVEAAKKRRRERNEVFKRKTMHSNMRRSLAFRGLF